MRYLLPPPTGSRARLGVTVGPALLLLAAASLITGIGVALELGSGRPEPRLEAEPTEQQVAPDTVTVYGPRRFEIEGAGSALHVEAFPVTLWPGAEYVVVVTNGSEDGGGRVERAGLVLNGVELLSDEEPLSVEGAVREDVDVADRNELVLELSGPAESYVTLSVHEVRVEVSPVIAEMSSMRASDGQRIAIALSPQIGTAVDAIYGELRYDPQALAYLGLDPESDALVTVNPAQERSGRLRFVAVSPYGLGREAARFVFEVQAGSYAESVSVHLLEYVLSGQDRLGTEVAVAVVENLDVRVAVEPVEKPTRWRDVWTQRREAGGPGPYFSFEPFAAGSALFGDADWDGDVDQDDVDFICYVRAGVYPVPTDPDSVIRMNVDPGNTPGLGEPGDPYPPGWETPYTAWNWDIDMVDVNVVSAEVTGLHDYPVVGAEIPADIQKPRYLPLLIVPSPDSGTVVDTLAVPVYVAAGDSASFVVTIDGDTVASGANEAIQFVELTPLANEGANDIVVVVTASTGAVTAQTIPVIRDTQNPVLQVTTPADGTVVAVDTVVISGSVTDLTAVTVDANGVPLPVDGAGAFSGTVSLADGANVLTITATDEAGHFDVEARVVTLDSVPPSLTVTSPDDQSSTEADSVDVTGTATDATEVTLTLNSVSVPLDSLGAFAKPVAVDVGVNTLAFLATDEAGNQTVDTITVTRNDSGLPPDPSTVASPIEPNVATTIGSATAFLYEGPDPIQTGVAPGTIDPVRVAVLKGRVLDRSAQPLSGVTVSVLGHPEFGQTLTRSDGQYDLAVNGGGLLNVRFQKAGYPEVQRRSELPWQDYYVLEDVVLTPLDTAVTTIDFSDPIQIAQGTPQTDSDGTRQATLMFRQGTTATMTLPSGTVDTLSSISVRATEYTVGEDGPEAMPGLLPATTVYTYASELSVDEAIAAGAERVDFSQPVSFYVDNFLGMPVGVDVPVGYFDRTQGEWVGAQDGRVIEVVGIDSLGVASLNIDTIAGAEHPDTLLAHLNIDSDELAAIGSKYSIGDQ